jgi:hypothetical protein
VADADAAAVSSGAVAPAAHPGALAAGARPDLLPRLTDAIIMAGFDRFDPGLAFFLVLTSTARVGQSRRWPIFHPLDKEQACWRAKGVSVVRENVLNVRSQVAFDRRVRKP